MLPEIVRNNLRYRLSVKPQTRCVAATASFDEANRHLRIDFFDGTSGDVDFEALEFGALSEAISDIWAGVETVGFSVVFDALAAAGAVRDPDRLYPP